MSRIAATAPVVALFLATSAFASGYGNGSGNDHGQGHGYGHDDEYEVWLLDQSNSTGTTFGGKLLIYDGDDLENLDEGGSVVPTDVIDIGGATSALCLASTGANPVRPHMILFNGTHTHAAVAFVASGHVVIYDAATRAPVSCLRTSVGSNGLRQAHAAFPSPDDSYILIANQNGKRLERIDTDYATNTFTLNPAAAIDFITCTTPNGVACEAAGIRPDNAPICPIIDRSGDLGFITLRGGGMFIVDPRTTPMQIVGEYDMAHINGNGCGGVDTDDAMFMNSGGGTAANLDQFDVYRFPLSGYSAANAPNTPTAINIFSDPSPNRDAHGMTLTEDDAYLWVADRNANVIEVFDTDTNAHVNTIPLTLTGIEDMAPDLMDISPDKNRVVVSTRGALPLSGDPHSSTGSDPGLLVIDVDDDGETAEIIGHVPITNVDAGGVERADAHGVRIRPLPDDDHGGGCGH